MGTSIPHVVTDVVLLGFPVPRIWNLRLHKSRKVILTVIFSLGILYIALFSCLFHKYTAGIGAKNTFFSLTNIPNPE